MSNQDSNESEIENTIVEKLSSIKSNNIQNNNESKSTLGETDTVTSSATTTPVPIAEEENLSNDSSNSSSNSNSPKLTAEWTVHAQLTFRNKKPGDKNGKDNITNSSTNNDPNNPIKVSYKWSSQNEENIPPDVQKEETNTKQSTTTTKTKTSTSKIPLLTKKDKNDKTYQGSLGKGQSESFRSTATTADSGNCSNQSPRKILKYGTRCKSTCNIILSAVADFLPPSKNINNASLDSEPVTFNTTTTYTVSPEQEIIKPTASSLITSQNNFPISKICSLRDAFSQTSDTETKYIESSKYPIYGEQISLCDLERKKQKAYQQRRHTDSVMSTPCHRKTSSLPAEEGNSFMPSLFKSPPSTHKSPSLPKIPPLPTQLLQNLANQTAYGSTLESGGGVKSDIKKPPRTVHIDVYCTGSDEEEDDDEEDDLSLSMSSEENKHDMESNSTPQTVLDTEQMILKHKRAGLHDLPRKLLNQPQYKQHPGSKTLQSLSTDLQNSRSGSNIKSPILFNSTSPKNMSNNPEMILNVGHAITKSTTAEEVNESKHMLFKKHLGDQRNNKLSVRNNKNICKDTSDDAISSNYPNSSRSTMRDMTCSSISSKAMSSFDMESSWKETEVSVGRNDSFDYDNARDRMRIKNMEKLWSGSSTEQFYPYDNSNQDEEHRLNYRSVQPSPETPPMRNTSPQKLYISPNQTTEMPIKNQTLQKSNFNTKNNFYNSQQGYSYSTPPQQPFPSPGGQSYAQTLTNYNSSPQPYLGPIHRPSHPSTSPRPVSPHQNRIQHFLQGYSQQDTIQYPWRQRQQQTNTPNYELFPEPTAKYYGFTNQTIPERDETNNTNNKSPNFMQEPSISAKSLLEESSNQKYTSMPQYLSHQISRAQRFGSEDRNPFDLPDRRPRVMFAADYNKSGSESSTLQSNLSGYTTDYLAKARRFGSVVTQMRKPGHHIGPAKNPDCECEHCKRWFTERSGQNNYGAGRGRAYSMGDTPKGVFWLRKEPNN